jgi:gliding motility-associated-like protein
MSFSKKSLIFTIVCLFFFQTSAKSQTITISNTLTPEELVRDVLLGGGVTVSNVVFTGQNTQKGSFIADTLAINLELDFVGGIILSTGNSGGARGPNLSPSTTTDHPAGPGDADPELNGIANGAVQDAVLLEFDFIPTTDTVQFNFVFASEEYDEFVNMGFNDVFGFFVTGPGLADNTNVALVPGTNDIVSINTVNATSNPIYYKENVAGRQLSFDGLTRGLTAIVPVIPCETYHLKIAIADVGDGLFDSAVFLEAGSFVSDKAYNLAPVFANPDNILAENCGTGIIKVQRLEDFDVELKVPIEIGGVAQNGIDYEAIPDTVTILAGDTFANLTITPIADGVTEGQEFGFIRFEKNIVTCLNDSVAFFIQDLIPPALTLSEDTTICAGTSATLKSIVTGGSGDFSYLWSNGAPTPNITVQPVVTAEYTLNLRDLCGNEVLTETVTVEVIAALEKAQVTCGTPTESSVSFVWEPVPGAISYEVSDDGGVTWIIPTSGSTGLSHEILGLQKGDTRTLVVKTSGPAECGASTYSDPVTCEANSCTPIVVTLTASSNSIFLGEDVTLSPVVQTTLTDVSYVWAPFNFTTGITPVSTDPKVSTMFYFYVYDNVVAGCPPGIDSAFVEVVDAAFSIHFPNAFSPNSDGNNENFIPMEEGVAEFRLSIFNRWGEKIFETTDIKTGWEGTYQNSSKVAEDGLYLYIAYARGINGQEELKSGTISLSR